MIIEAIDSKNDTFLVKDVFPENILNDILQLAEFNTDWEKLTLQEHQPRKVLKLHVFDDINSHNLKLLSEINEHLGSNYKNIFADLWCDTLGYESGIHLDNEQIVVSMQCYLGEASSLGTCFYTKVSEDNFQIRKEFNFIENTGYLMINNDNQWHGMTKDIPDGKNRLSVYFRIT